MIWQLDVKVVVMLAQRFEEQKVKKTNMNLK